jgi:hypothetical protein
MSTSRLSLTLFLLLPCAWTSARADTVVVFNEIMYHPATNESALEWVELYNQMAVDVDISQWTLTGGIDFAFPSGTIVTGGGHVVVAVNPAALAAATGSSGILGPYTGRLSNNGETLRLRNNSGRVVDEISYGVGGNWPVGADGAGVSLAKRNPETASDSARNWTVSDLVGGTPGRKNFLLDTDPPAVTQLIEVTDAWRVEASGTDLGTAWRATGFNDAAWTSRSSFVR